MRTYEGLRFCWTCNQFQTLYKIHGNLLLRLYKFAVATRTGCVRLKSIAVYRGNLFVTGLQPAWVALD